MVEQMIALAHLFITYIFGNGIRKVIGNYARYARLDRSTTRHTQG